MTIENFKNLIEVQGLEDLIHNHLKLVESHKRRIIDIETEKKKKKASLEESEHNLLNLKNELSTTEKELYSAETKLQQSKDNLLSIKSTVQLNALETEINNLTPKTSTLENSSLELMDKIELLQVEIDTLKVFLKGVNTTIIEINKEVELDIIKENKEIENYNHRIESLLNECSKEHRNAFIGTNKSYKFKSPLAFVENDSCNKCHFGIDRNLQSIIKKGRTIELCPGCQRILVPEVILNI